MLSRFWFILLLSPAMCEQMDWGDNPYLVDESVTIQGREHIKLAVVMVGGSIDLECQVAFTSEPVSKIMWKMDGKLKNDAENQTKEIKNGEIFLEAHLNIVNITTDMDGSTVSCQYSKGQYGASVETVFRVFSAELEIPDKVCKNSIGNVKLTFKESKGTSPAEETVAEKIKAMIDSMTNVAAHKIIVDESGYSINLPLTAVYDNDEIMDMKPETKIDGAYAENGLSQCTTTTKPSSTQINNIPNDTEYNEISLKSDEIERGKDGWFFAILVISLLGAVIFLASLFAKRMVKQRNNSASRLKDVEEVSEMLEQYFCNYCNFVTKYESELESHESNYKTTHSHLDYNDHQHDFDIEMEKMKNNDLKLKMENLTEKQKEYLNTQPYPRHKDQKAGLYISKEASRGY